MKLKFTYLYVHLFKSDGFRTHTHILVCIPSSDVNLLGENINIRKGNFGVTFRWLVNNTV
jgi:hypothetical protein